MSQMIINAEQLLVHMDHPHNTRPRETGKMFIPLAFIDDCNPIRIGAESSIDKALVEAAKEFKMQWDKSKN